MNLSEVAQLVGYKKNYVKYPDKQHYSMKYADINNISEYSSDLKTVVKLIKEELTDWEEAPTYKTVIDRFEAGSYCLLFYYNDDCIGWNWGNKNVCFDWQTVFQELEPGEIYAGGCYVAKNVKRPADAGFYNYNMVLDYFYNQALNHTVYGYVELWNKAAIRVNLQNGIIISNYLDEKKLSSLK